MHVSCTHCLASHGSQMIEMFLPLSTICCAHSDAAGVRPCTRWAFARCCWQFVERLQSVDVFVQSALASEPGHCKAVAAFVDCKDTCRRCATCCWRSLWSKWMRAYRASSGFCTTTKRQFEYVFLLNPSRHGRGEQQNLGKLLGHVLWHSEAQALKGIIGSSSDADYRGGPLDQADRESNTTSCEHSEPERVTACVQAISPIVLAERKRRMHFTVGTDADSERFACTCASNARRCGRSAWASNLATACRPWTWRTRQHRPSLMTVAAGILGNCLRTLGEDPSHTDGDAEPLTFVMSPWQDRDLHPWRIAGFCRQPGREWRAYGRRPLPVHRGDEGHDRQLPHGEDLEDLRRVGVKH